MAREQAPAMPADRALGSWNAELAFRAVVEATADMAGLEFLRHLVKNLARSLGVAYAFVAEFADAADRVRTIAFWGPDDWRPNIEYGLAGTPCEQVVGGDFCIHRDDVQRLFPADSDLVALGARSYLGIPLRGAQGQTLGHLAAIDTRPMTDDPRGLAIFEVFANRARVEIERLHAEAVLPVAGRTPPRLPESVRPGGETLADVERRHLIDTLVRTGWRVDGPQGAAHALGLNPSTLRSRMKKLGIRRSASATG